MKSAFPWVAALKPPLAGVTVKDMKQHGFIRAPVAFLKKFGKLKFPKWVDTVKLSIKSLFSVIRTGSRMTHFHRAVPVSLRHQVGALTKICGGHQRNSITPSHFSQGSKNVAHRVLQVLEGLKVTDKDQDRDHKLTPWGQRGLDRISGQMATTNKKH